MWCQLFGVVLTDVVPVCPWDTSESGLTLDLPHIRSFRWLTVFYLCSVLDMLRFHKFTIGHAWTTEFGSADNAEEFDWIIKYGFLLPFLLLYDVQYLCHEIRRLADISSRQRLRSSSMSAFIVLPTWLSTDGDTAFPVSSHTWNSLPFTSLRHHLCKLSSRGWSRFCLAAVCCPNLLFRAAATCSGHSSLRA